MVKPQNNEQLPETLLRKLKNIPRTAGVYQFKNAEGTVIYIGKAKNLNNRVRSYFQQGRPHEAKTVAMVSKIADVEFIIVDSEAEALLLEDALVKKMKPRYNILLRDDKSFPYIRVTNELFPRIFKTRKKINDGSKYFGPYTEGRNVKQLLLVIRNMFQIRSCDLNITAESIEHHKHKVCLDYHIKKCEGPCEGFVNEQSYHRNIQNAIQILNGKTEPVEHYLESEMQRLAEEMKFEDAAKIRDKYLLLKDYKSTQKIITAENIDRDIAGFSRAEKSASVVIFKVREGKLIGKRNFIIPDNKSANDGDMLQSALEKWFIESDFPPDELLLPFETEQISFVADLFESKFHKKLQIHYPKIGEKRKLVNLANANAEYELREYQISLMKKEQTVPRAVLALQRDLKLAKPPVRIECFDNSHIQGSDYVSSMVVFVDGKPRKNDYRKFKLRTVEGNDDFAAMREVITRRYSRVLKENLPMPDLVIVDGGKGQLSSAIEALKALSLDGKLQIVGIAKRLDEIIVPYSSDTLLLPKTSSSLRLIQALRDEAHRFAITYHRDLRLKRTLHTELTEISGIGEKIAQKLLIAFGSVDGVRHADRKALEDIVGKSAAAKVFNFFNEAAELD
jgi:excinuclease ABC subunit C